MADTRQEFDVTLTDFGDGGCGFLLPFDVLAVYGSRGRIKVRATIDGVVCRGSIAPYGDQHYLGVNRAIRDSIGKACGESVHVNLERDDAPRVVEIPADLAQALDAESKATFDALSYSHQKEYVDWIVQARKPETRARRIAQTIERVHANNRSIES